MALLGTFLEGIRCVIVGSRPRVSGLLGRGRPMQSIGSQRAVKLSGVSNSHKCNYRSMLGDNTAFCGRPVDFLLNVEYIINMDAGFGRALREFRRRAGLSQRQLAQVVGVDFSYISKLENGRLPPPSTDTIVRIADALGIAPDELLAAARKVPRAVGESLAGTTEAQRFLQLASNMKLSDTEWEQLVGQLKNLRGGTSHGGS